MVKNDIEINESIGHPYGATFWNGYLEPLDPEDEAFAVGTAGGSGGGVTFFSGPGYTIELWQDEGPGTSYNGLPHGVVGQSGWFYMGWRDTSDDGHMIAFRKNPGSRAWISHFTNIYTNAMSEYLNPAAVLYSCGRKNGDSFYTNCWNL